MALFSIERLRHLRGYHHIITLQNCWSVISLHCFTFLMGQLFKTQLYEGPNKGGERPVML